MMKNKFMSISALVSCGVLASACVALNDHPTTQESRMGIGPSSEFKFNHQNLVNGTFKSDAKGYTRYYYAAGNPDERIIVNYGQGIKESPGDAVAEVLNVDRQAGCASTTHHVYKQSASEIKFSTQNLGCPNDLNFYTYRRVFDQADGQYSITYFSAYRGNAPLYRPQMKNIVDTAVLIGTWSKAQD
jgi:hypothetical protein